MYNELPSLTRCCFCAPLRLGLLVWAYINLVFSIFVFGCGLIWISMLGMFSMFHFTEGQIYGFILSTTTLILCLSDVIFNFVLIVGAHKKNTTLLRLFYRYAVVHAILFVILSALTIALASSPHTGIRQDDVGYVIAICSTTCCIFLIIYMYELLLVRSEIVKLTPNGQFRFLNHNANSRCIMDVENQAKDKSKEILLEKPAS